MAGSGPHQENPRQADPQRTKPIGHQRQNNLSDPRPNPGNGRNREGSVHTTQTSQSHSQVGSRISQRRNNYQAMQREIDDLKKKLRHAQRRQSLSSSDTSSNEKESVTGGGQELPQVKHFLTRRSCALNGDIRAHLVRVWVMMP